MRQVTCEICVAIENSMQDDRKLWNYVLHEDKIFLILPSLGPLIEGQGLIVSKQHKLNLLSMTNEEKRNVSSLVNYCQQILGNNILFAEHGSFDNQMGG